MSFEFAKVDRNLTIHNYDADGVYLSTKEVVVKAGTGLPANSTLSDLPDLDDEQIAVFDSESEGFIATYDYRGETIYSTETMESSIVTELGTINEGYTRLSPSTVYDVWDSDLEVWVTDEEAQSVAENQVTYKTEYEWSESELALSDIEINKHLDLDENATSTEENWRTYRKALRAYCSSSTDDDGNVTYAVNDISDTYTVDDTGRPITPSNE